MEPKVLLLLSQEPVTCSSPESGQSGPCPAHLCEKKSSPF